jgi:hypothetical protein
MRLLGLQRAGMSPASARDGSGNRPENACLGLRVISPTEHLLIEGWSSAIVAPSTLSPWLLMPHWPKRLLGTSAELLDEIGIAKPY